MATPVQRSAHQGVGLYNQPPAPPQVERELDTERKERAPSSSAGPAIVNRDATRLSQKPISVYAEELNFPSLYLQIELGFSDNPEQSPEELGQQLALLPDLLPLFLCQSYSSIKSGFGAYMNAQRVDRRTQQLYMKVVAEICKQATLNSKYKEIARDFQQNARAYVESASYQVFQSAIHASQSALERTRQLPSDPQLLQLRQQELNRAASQIDHLAKLHSIASGRDGQLTKNVIGNTFRSAMRDFQRFCDELNRRRHDSPLGDLHKRLRERMETLLAFNRQIVPAPKASPLQTLFEVEAEAIWKAGFLLLKTAIMNSPRDPAVIKQGIRSADAITEQTAFLVWESALPESASIDQRELIQRFITRLPPEYSVAIQKELASTHDSRDPRALDKRTQILFDAIIRFIGKQVTLSDLLKFSGL